MRVRLCDLDEVRDGVVATEMRTHTVTCRRCTRAP